MRAMRGLFFVLAAASACFADSGVKRSVYLLARVCVGIFTALFVVAEIMDLIA